MKQFIACIFIVMSLTRCAPLIVAGAAAGAVVYDSRTVWSMERDARIFHIVHKNIIKDPLFSRSSVDVSVFNQVVLLAGQVSNASLKNIAEKLARETPNVERVYDQLEIGPPISLTQQGKDSWITSEVTARMIAEKGLHSGSIKVVTNNSVVYLMGIVNKKQAEKAVNIARHTDKVKKVVKVFQYIV